MKVESIFIDLDGVLCDMVGSALRVHNRQDVLETWVKGMYDIEDVLGIAKNHFWKVIDSHGYEFWSELEPYPWMDQLYRAALRITDNVILCTKPSKAHFSSGGKHQWILQNFGSQFRNYIITPHKHHCSAPGRVLIDDSEKNIEEWRHQGGTGILFPQVWNSGNGTFADVVRQLDAMSVSS